MAQPLQFLTQTVTVAAGEARLAGDLAVPPAASGIVVFAHGSGSGRHSPRNRQVAAQLQANGLATLLLDLLTEAEEQHDLRTGQHRFDVSLLADRLIAAIDWLGDQATTTALPIGCFGASTGAAAALIAAARRPEAVRAMVSRGGRPDLARDSLAVVSVPTLLIVGSADPQVLELNRQAGAQLRGEWRLEIVDGASHLFEEIGALERVAELAGEWFLRHLPAA